MGRYIHLSKSLVDPFVDTNETEMRSLLKGHSRHNRRLKTFRKMNDLLWMFCKGNNEMRILTVKLLAVTSRMTLLEALLRCPLCKHVTRAQSALRAIEIRDAFDVNGTCVSECQTWQRWALQTGSLHWSDKAQSTAYHSPKADAVNEMLYRICKIVQYSTRLVKKKIKMKIRF